MRDLSDKEVGRLQEMLDAAASVAGTGEALDVSALDGFLCGVLLQPQRVAESAWLPLVLDPEGLALLPPPVAGPPPWLEPVRRRCAVLDGAIAARRWFDPWLFDVQTGMRPGGTRGGGGDAGHEDTSLHECVLPWVAGFALANERFPGLMQLDAQALAAPLALLYLHFDAEDLEGLDDEPALAAALAATEPPADLAQAAEDLVRAVLLLADLSRPRREPPVAAPRTATARAPRGPRPRSRSARRARARRV